MTLLPTLVGIMGAVIVAQEILVAVRKVYRRALNVDVGTDVGLIICVWIRIAPVI